jgi:type IV secretory pathway VirB10-like protein
LEVIPRAAALPVLVDRHTAAYIRHAADAHRVGGELGSVQGALLARWLDEQIFDELSNLVMRWDEMRWDEMRWDEMRREEKRRDKMRKGEKERREEKRREEKRREEKRREEKRREEMTETMTRRNTSSRTPRIPKS